MEKRAEMAIKRIFKRQKTCIWPPKEPYSPFEKRYMKKNRTIIFKKAKQNQYREPNTQSTKEPQKLDKKTSTAIAAKGRR